MRVRKGFVYHIRDEYFDLVRGCGIKNIAENGKTFPAFCCSKDHDNDLLWMVPASTKIEKYKAIAEKELCKYDHCFSVVFGYFDAREVAFLVQDTFPVLKKYILHPHTRKGKVIQVDSGLRESIYYSFEEMMKLHKCGVKCLLTDIDKIKNFVC